MVTCKVKGFMDPVSGQCNCDSGFVNKISNEKKVRKFYSSWFANTIIKMGKVALPFMLRFDAP